MLVTAGFRDILDMGYESRYDLYDLRLRFPRRSGAAPPAGEIDERVRPTARSSAARPSTRSVRTAVASWVEGRQGSRRSPSACCIPTPTPPTSRRSPSCWLSQGVPRYLRLDLGRRLPQHARVRALDDDDGQRLHPADVRPLPEAAGGRAGGIQGFRGPLYIMTSSGGTLTTETARRFPVRALESGPAAGALMSRPPRPQPAARQCALLRHGRHHGQGRAGPRRRAAQEVHDGGRARSRVQARQRPARAHPGHRHDRDRCRRRQPRRVDERGCCGRAEAAPAPIPGPPATAAAAQWRDADRRQPRARLSSMPASSSAAPCGSTARQRREAIRRSASAKPLKLSWRAPPGASTRSSTRTWRAPSASMPPSAASTIAGASMVAFGGSGPLHALSIARKLKIPRVIFPVGRRRHVGARPAGQPAAFEVARSAASTSPTSTREAASPRDVRRLEAEASGYLLRAGVAGDRHPHRDAASTCATRARATRSR
jgi:N-methylhydantoinase A